MVGLLAHRSRLRTAALVLTIAAIPLLLLVFNHLLAREFDRARLLAAQVERSHAIRAELRNILSLEKDVETGQRGYVLTANPDFLEPFEASRRSLPATLSRLRRLSHDQAQQAAIDELERLALLRVAQGQAPVDLMRRGQRDRAVALIARAEGKRTMDLIRALVDRLDASERQWMTRFERQAELARRESQLFAYRLQALLTVLLLVAAALVMRSLASRRRALERFRDLSARQEAIFASAQDAMLILTPDGTIESLNPAASRMYGYAPEEMLGQNVALLFEDPPKPREVTAFLQSLRPGRDAHTREFGGRRRDGSTFPTEVATSPVSLASGSCFLSMIRDISERKQVERMKDEFVSTVSHELRTPLTSIAGSLGLLVGGAAGALPERADRLVRIAQSNSQRLVRLINDILDIEKMEAGKLKFERKWLDLRSVLEQAVQANRGFAGEHRVELTLEPVPDHAVVIADEDRLLQVMDNLLSNAAKFAPPGSQVRIVVAPAGEGWRISVADSGPGIPESFRDRIFQKFAQADSSDTRQKGGTGLGLSIVREIVTRLDGSVSFESRPGEGTTFHVVLPAVHRSPARERAAPDGPPDQLRIIHVDDDADTLRLVANALEGKADILSSPSVREAHAAIQRQHFDAAILDIEMADGSGLDLLPILASGDRRVPVILFTVHDPTPELAAQADAVLTKSRSPLDELARRTIEIATGARREEQK